jgi:hypothetical protein
MLTSTICTISRVGAVALYAVLWAVVAKCRTGPLSEPSLIKAKMYRIDYISGIIKQARVYNNWRYIAVPHMGEFVD